MTGNQNKDCERVLFGLQEYLDGEADAEGAAFIDAHLLLCSSCREEAETQKEIKSLIADTAETPPEGLYEKIMQRVKAEKRRARLTALKRCFTVAAAILLIIAAIPIIKMYQNGSMIFNRSSKAEISALSDFNRLNERESEEGFYSAEDGYKGLNTDCETVAETREASVSASIDEAETGNETRSPSAGSVTALPPEETLPQMTWSPGHESTENSETTSDTGVPGAAPGTQPADNVAVAGGFVLGRESIEAILRNYKPAVANTEEGYYIFGYDKALLREITENSQAFISFSSEDNKKYEILSAENGLSSAIVILSSNR